MKKSSKFGLEIQLVNTLSTMLNAYEQIYVVKMQKIRERVVRNRDFLTGVAQVFGELKWAYIENLEVGGDEVETVAFDPESLSVLTKNGKSVAILLTATKKWAGDINKKVINKFVSYIKEHQDYEIIIVGSTGKEWFKRARIERKYEYFDLSEEKVDLEELKPLVEKIISYENAVIFYGKFINLVRQEEIQANVRGGEIFKMPVRTDRKKQKIIFEPTLKELLVFFETQVFGSIYKQVAHESYLAQIGARINNLRSANENISTRMKELTFRERKFLKSQKNKKQRQSLAGMALWKN